MDNKIIIILILLLFLFVLILWNRKQNNEIQDYLLNTCATNPDCQAGQLCLQQYCINPTCLTDVDCVVNNTNNPQYQTCVNGTCQPKPCSSTSSCAGGQACINNVCLPTGEKCNTTCYGGQLKCNNNTCVVCVTNADCPGNIPCINNSCQTCKSNSDCPGTNCLQDGTCGPCGTNKSCLPGYVCDINGQCVVPSGGNTGACTTFQNCVVNNQYQGCVNNVCAPCQADSDCLYNPQFGKGSASLSCQSGVCVACKQNSDCHDNNNCVQSNNGGICEPT